MYAHVFALVSFALAVLAGPSCAGEAVEIRSLRTWFGTIKEPGLRELAPAGGVITDAKAFETIWKAWKPLDETPALDFTRDFLLVVTENKGKVDKFVLKLDRKGDLSVAVGFSVLEKLPGFSFGIAQISRAGIVSVRGTRLKPAAGKERPSGRVKGVAPWSSLGCLSPLQEVRAVFSQDMVVRRVIDGGYMLGAIIRHTQRCRAARNHAA